MLVQLISSLLHLTNDALYHFPILKSFHYRHILEYDCELYPVDLIYALLQFIAGADGIVLTTKNVSQSRSIPSGSQKM